MQASRILGEKCKKKPKLFSFYFHSFANSKLSQSNLQTDMSNKTEKFYLKTFTKAE